MTRTAAERERLVFAARVSFLFAALAAVIGTNMPFLPVWLDWAGLTPSEIAIVTATPLLVRVAVTPAIAFAADRAGDHRTFLIGLAWLGLAGLLALAQSRGFWPILVFTIVFSLSWTTNMPLAETVAVIGVKAAGLDYGRMRLWGSLSFIAASLAGGWVIQVLGAASAIWLIVAASLLVVAAAQALPPPIGQGRLRAATGPPRLSLADATGLVRSRIFLIFLAAGGLTSASHAVLYTFGTLHWRAQGLSTGWSGTLWAISIVAEVALFAWSAAAVARAGPVGLVALGAGASLLRWLVMGLDPPLAVLVPLQLLHAATFGATHIGAIHFIGRTVPETQAGTAQALYASVTGGIAMGAAMLAAGPLYAAYAGGAYWAMAVLAGAGLAASLVLLRARP